MKQLTTPFFKMFRTPMPKGNVRRSAQLAVEALEDRALMAASFFAPVEPSGTINLQLVPLANVTTGTQEIVTFGMPFTRGSVTQAGLSNVRILKNGVEIPAYIEQLTPWRSLDNPTIDGQSVRVARIQIGYTFNTLNPETITVQWGGPARTLNRPSLQDPRLEWHTVTSGTFVAADNVEEPDVLPLLPREYLAKGMFDARTLPLANSVAETRDDPAVMDSMTFNGYEEYDYAQKNFFYTIINQNPGITINYKTQAEPWLYDRASAMYGLYLRSGFGTALREAVRNADFYADRLNSSGYFTLSSSDPKYAYNEALAYTYWLLGDNRMLAPISTVVNAHSGTASRWNPNLNFWTERNVGYKLLANTIAYEVTGNTTFKNNVQTIVNDLLWHQNGAGGQLPTNRIDGGLYHEGGQHDASEVGDPNVLIASPWMSALIVDPMVRAYGLTESTQIADFLVRMGNFVKTAAKFDANGQFGGTTRYPDYLMRTDGTSENRSDTDVQHAMDVGAIAAWATYFAELRGTPQAGLRQLANDLYATYDVGVNYWTRPDGTNFNVSPPRRYTWEYKNSSNFSWALSDADVPGQPGALQFNAANYSVNENQGGITITITRTGGSNGSVSVNYATSNGSATAGTDYAATTGTLTFLTGETSKTFTIPIINDTLVENNETVNLTLSNPTGGATLGSQNTATLTIVSDDAAPQPGVLQFSNATYAVTENGGIATITVTRTSGTSGTVSVNYTTNNGSATAGADYTASSGTLTFLNGEASKTFTVAITNDTATEGNETVVLTLSNPTGGATLGNPATATLTITDDDSGQFVTVSYQQGVNGYTGTTDASISTQYAQYTGGNGTTSFTDTQLNVYQTSGTGSYIMESLIRFANLGIPTNAAVTGATLTLRVDTWTANPTIRGYYLLAPWSGTPGSNNTQLGWLHSGTGQDWASPGARGQGTDVVAGKSFTIPGITGTGGQTITINLDPAVVQNWVNNPSTNQGILLVNESTGAIVRINASEHGTASTRPRLSVTYTTGTPPPQSGAFQFSNATYAITENGGAATITVTRSNGSAGSVSVNYATSNGSATAGSDYTTSTGTLTFAQGETSKTFTIPILNDTLVENTESLNLTLSNPTGGATLGSQSTAILTIQDDDVPSQAGSLQFNATSYSLMENGGLLTVTVTRTGGTSGTVSVQYATSNGSASAGADYAAASGTLFFASGEASKTFTVAVIDDSLVEGNETFTLSLSNPTGGATLGNPTTASVIIIENDAPPPTGAFTNVTTVSGVGAIITQKYQETPNWWLSGQHLIDLDNDGDLDLYLSNHGGGSVVALNNGNGVFTRLTTGSFPDTEIHQMYDINEDGRVDVSMTYQDGGGRWWVNNSLPGTVNFTATNITRGGNTSRSQVMLDFNGDGKVDWLRSAPPGVVVDFGNGLGGFTEGSLTFTIPGTSSNNNASFLPADFDDDGDLDLLLLVGGNYDGTPGKTLYWRNNGNMTFTDITISTGIPANGTIAKGIGDYDQDGDTDFIALENKSMPPVIYLNNGQGVFTKKAGAVTGAGSGTLDYSFWGTAISTDFDNDGIVDIIMNGKYFLKVLRGTGGGNFTSMNTAWGIKDIAASAVDDGLCFGDMDGDGDLDIIGYNEIWPTETLNVYRNDLAPRNWINVRPVGLAGNKGAAGAKISVYAAGTNQLLWYEQVATYDFQVATSYYAYGETERHFGLGNRAVVDVAVEFYGNGQVTRINNVAANQTIRVLESTGSMGLMAAPLGDDSVWSSYGTKAELSKQDHKHTNRTAVSRLGAASTDRQQVTGVRLALTALPDRMLDRHSGKRIEIDYHAVGKGWFLDTTPRTDHEFTDKTRLTGLDLLGGFNHEPGQILGLELGHTDPDLTNILASDVGQIPSLVRTVD